MNAPNSTELLQQGRYPYPGESCKQWKARCSQEAEPPLPLADPLPPEVIHEAALWLQGVCSIAPRWIPAYYGGNQLAWFHLGALIVEEDDQGKVHEATLILARRWQHCRRWMGYERHIVLAHEMVHYLRAELDQFSSKRHRGRYEEYLAYGIDPVAYRRWLGPLLTSIPFLLGLSLLTASCLVNVITLTLFDPHRLSDDVELQSWIPLSLGGCGTFFALSELPKAYRWWRLQRQVRGRLLAGWRWPFLLSLTSEQLHELAWLPSQRWDSWVRCHTQGAQRSWLLLALRLGARDRGKG